MINQPSYPKIVVWGKKELVQIIFSLVVLGTFFFVIIPWAMPDIAEGIYTLPVRIVFFSFVVVWTYVGTKEYHFTNDRLLISYAGGARPPYVLIFGITKSAIPYQDIRSYAISTRRLRHSPVPVVVLTLASGDKALPCRDDAQAAEFISYLKSRVSSLR